MSFKSCGRNWIGRCMHIQICGVRVRVTMEFSLFDGRSNAKELHPVTKSELICVDTQIVHFALGDGNPKFTVVFLASSKSHLTFIRNL